ncbi:hypothetical protein LPJ61_004772 [Coemansia biformis]|uniref:Sphingomyelin synthase-like domain-containing protein n=1 Tax=Coemansia biformis TaxID=1286918 RepID=A0A9W7Y8U9_9FUNG|nr:hypothetical protein LPJ61_004772 [Coemansia biformis]
MAVVAAVVRQMRRAAALVGSRTFLQDMGRLGIAAVVFYIVSLWMVTCQQWSDTRWIRRLQEQQKEWASTATAETPWPAQALLQDQVLGHLPVLEQTWISDKLVGSSILGGLVGCSLMVSGWRQRVMLVRRGVWMVAVLYFLRSITISVTTVPPSSPTCRITAPNSIWENIKATPDIIAGNVGQCTDKVFSGHTAILTLMLLFWCRYATHWAFIAVSGTHTAVGILTVLMARYHYTVDVLVGLLLTYFVHHTYYVALDRAVCQRAAEGCLPAANERGYSQLPMQQHAPPKPDDDADDADIAASLGEAGGGAYDMAVFAKPGDDGWRDHDSVLGVDVSGRQTPIDQQNSVFRKRETSAAAAGTPLSDAGANHSHHEILVAEPADDRVGARADGTAEHRTHHHIYGHAPHGMAAHPHPLLGINRPFSAILPAIVAWMDGLDIRINAAV